MAESLPFPPLRPRPGSGYEAFDHRSRLFATARRVLMARTLVTDLDPAIADLVSNELLPHVERIERGLHATLRASSLGDTLASVLVRRAGILSDEPAMSARRAGPLDLTFDTGLEDVAHADLVLAFIPRLPDSAVCWPMRARRSYADIASPADASERIARIEELERVLWWLATGARVTSDEPWRRTYAFFEVGAWLDRAALGLPPLDA